MRSNILLRLFQTVHLVVLENVAGLLLLWAAFVTAEEPLNICEGRGRNARLPHNDCTKYWFCTADGQLKEVSCPPQLNFNVYLQLCDIPERTKCTPGGGSGGDTDEGKSSGDSGMCKGHEWTPERQKTRENRLKHSDCSKYWSCDGFGIAHELSCPQGFLFNDVKKLCDLAVNVKCAPDDGSGGDSNEDKPSGGSSICEGHEWTVERQKSMEYMVKHSDCRKYYSCTADGQPKEFFCPEGYLFNDVTKSCDSPENVNCTPGDDWVVTTGGTTVVSTMGPTTTEEIITTTASDHPATDPTPGPTVNICDGHAWTPETHESNDYLRHHDDCTKFWSCTAAGIPEEMDCPAGLEWNDAKKLCDWPAEAKCTPGGINPVRET